jgi:hypothetical protein
VQIEVFKVGKFVTFVVDGKMIEQVAGSDPLTFKPFTVTVGPGLTHFGMVSCHFPKDAPDDAKYQILLSGDAGGGTFTGSDIIKTDLSWDRGIELRRT